MNFLLDFKKTILYQVEIIDSYFSALKFESFCISFSIIKNSSFSGQYIDDTNFFRSILINIDFERNFLKKVDFLNCLMDKKTFDKHIKPLNEYNFIPIEQIKRDFFDEKVLDYAEKVKDEYEIGLIKLKKD